MKISNRGKDLIKRFEGFRLEAYDDGAGVWTIGYGHTPAYCGQTITKENAAKTVECKNKKGAAEQFLRWCKAGGKTLKGLQKRREHEMSLFLEPVK